MLYKHLVFMEVSPLSPVYEFSNKGINSIILPLPSKYTVMKTKMESFRLCTRIRLSSNLWKSTSYNDYDEVSEIYFNIESSCNNYSPTLVDEVNNYNMLNYYADIRHILDVTYGFTNVKFIDRGPQKIFAVDLNLFCTPYSLLEVKTLLHVYNNPIKCEGSYLSVSSSQKNTAYNYSLLVESTLVYFSIGLDINETVCTTQIYWDKSNVTKSLRKHVLNYEILQYVLNERLLSYLPETTTDITESSPIWFRYYEEGNTVILESKCAIHKNNYIRRYLLALLTGKLFYDTSDNLNKVKYSKRA
jgi:hypothetical protein